MEIYVQHGQSGEPMRTERVTFKVVELPHHKQGLTYTPTGYGNKLPTVYKVLVQGRWRRVYSRCFSNTSSEYVIIDGKEVSVMIYPFD